MKLKQRLGTLRQQAGAQAANADAAAVATSEAPSRLARLQHARRHARPSARGAPVDDVALARCVDGRVLADGLLLVERRSALPDRGADEQHTRLPHLPEACYLSASDWAYIDTETTGLAGGSGTLAFMLGIGRVIDGHLVVRQYLLSRFAGERAMFEHSLAWLGADTGLISYNGKSFDLPLLKTRARLAGLNPSDWERPHLDLLHGTRRCFENRWPDCRLATVEARLLGIQRDDDLPGSEAPAAWLAHLRQGEPGRLPGVLAHNRQDLRSLGALLHKLAAVHQCPAGWDADTGRVARAWLRQGDRRQARRILEDAGDALTAADRLLLAQLRQRSGAPTAACKLLESLAADGVSEATERLAKYHEHKTRDLQRALHYARHLPAGPDRERRLRRLSRKQGLNHELPF